MKAVFVELPAFERHRSDYLNDAGFAQLQAGKDEVGDLTSQQCKALKTMIKAELEARRNP